MTHNVHNAIPQLQALLEKLSVSCEDIKIVDTVVHPLLSVTSADSDVLIGKEGENLRALNHILRRILDKSSQDDMRVAVDVNGYQRSKIEKVQRAALESAQKVRLFKHDVELPPMEGYERLIVHATFTEDSDIKTLSEGEGKWRHVVLKYSNSD